MNVIEEREIFNIIFGRREKEDKKEIGLVLNQEREGMGFVLKRIRKNIKKHNNNFIIIIFPLIDLEKHVYYSSSSSSRQKP